MRHVALLALVCLASAAEAAAPRGEREMAKLNNLALPTGPLKGPPTALGAARPIDSDGGAELYAAGTRIVLRAVKGRKDVPIQRCTVSGAGLRRQSGMWYTGAVQCEETSFYDNEPVAFDLDRSDRDADALFQLGREGLTGCWTDARAFDAGAEVYDGGRVIASGWKLRPDVPPSGDAAASWAADALAARGVTLGRVIGSVPTIRGADAVSQVRAPGTLVEAGPGRVAWLSHEENAAYVFWYEGATIPAGMTGCLEPVEPLFARTEAAIAAGDCGSVVDDLLPHTFGAPTPGAPERVARCDRAWRERAERASASDPLEALLALKRYEVRRELSIAFVGPRSSANSAKPYPHHGWPWDRPWLVHASGKSVRFSGSPLDAALAAALQRSDLTPAQRAMAPLLRRVLAGDERDAVGDARFDLTAVEALYPRVEGLAALGVAPEGIAKFHPMFRPVDTPTGPALWTVGDVHQDWTVTVKYDGPGRAQVQKSLLDDPCYQAYRKWEEEVEAADRAIDRAKWDHGACGWVAKMGGSERIETYSTYSVVTTRSWVDKVTWECPAELEAAQAAYQAVASRKPAFSCDKPEYRTAGRSRTSATRVDLGFTLGTKDERVVVQGSLDYDLHEHSPDADEPFWARQPDFQERRKPWRPSLTCATEGAPAALAPFLGTYRTDGLFVRICMEGEKARAWFAEGPPFDWSRRVGFEALVRSDGTMDYRIPGKNGQTKGVRLAPKGEGMTITVTDEGGNAVTREARRTDTPPPYGRVSDVLRTDFRDDSTDALGRWARRILANALLGDLPDLRGKWARVVGGYLDGELTTRLGAEEASRLRYLWGFGVDERAPASVLLLRDWYAALDPTPGAREPWRRIEGWRP